MVGMARQSRSPARTALHSTPRVAPRQDEACLRPSAVRLEIEFQGRLGRSVDLVDAGSCNAFLALDVIRGERIFEADGLACDKFDLYVMRRAGDLEPFERERRRMLLDPAP
jgi:hypothetical protein